MKVKQIPILLFNDECSVCRHIAHWVKKSAKAKLRKTSIDVRAIGEDPKALALISPGLNIWDAYATIHLVMPDGRLKLGGEAVAEVFRNLPKTRWLAKSFSISLFGFRPFQKILDIAYLILADIRPVFGCESCGAPKFWVKPFHFVAGLFKSGKSKVRPLTPISISRLPTRAVP